jgi:multisubunit Na+/H+ antiporter MnhB subunit
MTDFDDVAEECSASGLLMSVLAVAVANLTALLVFSVLTLDRGAGGLTAAVMSEIDRTGVEHPVTAVLLNFRSYDTWLELIVLFLSVLGVFALRGGRLRAGDSLAPGGQVLEALVGLLVPIMVLVGGYLLWLGKSDAGGAFQAGVVLGVALVMLWYGGLSSVEAMPPRILNAGLVAGPVAFLAAAVHPIVSGRAMLQFPEVYAGTIILAVETLATASIALVVACLVIGLNTASKR